VKSFCKSFLVVLMLGVMTMLPVGKAFCQSAPEPAVVISIAKFKEQMNDVNYLLTASGFAQMKFMAGAMIKGYTKGLDDSKDAGVLLYLNEESEAPDFLGFVPVADIEEMLDVIAQFAEIEESDDFATVITDDGTEMMIKEQNGFAFFSTNEDLLESLPDNPIKLLGDMPSKFNLGAKIFAQRIPAKLREQVTEMIREGAEQTFDSFEDDAQSELQRKNLEMQLKQAEELLEESDTLVIGMTADKDAKVLSMNVQFTALPNSKLAAKLAESKPTAPSRFSGFLMDGATFTQNACAKISAEEAAQYSKMLTDFKETLIKEMDQDGDLSDEELDTVKKSLGSMVEIVNETLAEGLMDAGAVLMLENGEINFAGGGQIADPKKLESSVKDLIAMAEEKMGDEITVNLNSGSHKSITLHEIIMQVPDDEEEVRDALGDQVTIILGIGDKEAYVAGGSNPVALLKKAVDGTNEASDVMQMNLNILPILKFAAQMEGDPNVEAMADALEKAGNDQMSMRSNMIENGFEMNFEMQDGILGLIKVAFDSFQAMGMPNDDF